MVSLLSLSRSSNAFLTPCLNCVPGQKGPPPSSIFLVKRTPANAVTAPISTPASSFLSSEAKPGNNGGECKDTHSTSKATIDKSATPNISQKGSKNPLRNGLLIMKTLPAPSANQPTPAKIASHHHRR